MHKLVVTVSNKSAKIVPQTHKLEISERDFGDIDVQSAGSGEDNLTKLVQSMLEENDITDAELYSVSYPDTLRDEQKPEPTSDETKEQTKKKGPVTKPKNPKQGEPSEE